MDYEDLRFYNPRAKTEVWRNRLPHWQQDGAVYFVTFRLADSVPRPLLRRWESERAAWLEHHPEPWTPEVEREYHTRFSGAMERWLDAGHGSCVLRDPACRSVVAETMRHFDGERCHHLCWVVMPNHVHALFVLRSSTTLAELMHSWKGFSAQRVNALLGRKGALWQADYFDRLVRDGGHLDNCIRYIRRNPVKAKLSEGEFTLHESDFAKAVL